MGQFIWAGIDYIGEPTPYHTRNCYFGQADTACFPKDPYYLFQSLWSDIPVLHIGVNWDWNEGQMIDVPVMTNGASAELFLNGRSLGKKRVDRRDPEACLPVWRVPYADGTLEARGYGVKRRTSFSLYRMHRADVAFFIVTTAFFGAATAGLIISDNFVFYPEMSAPSGTWAVLAYSFYGVLCALSVIYQLAEEAKWKLSLSKI